MSEPGHYNIVILLCPVTCVDMFRCISTCVYTTVRVSVISAITCIANFLFNFLQSMSPGPDSKSKGRSLRSGRTLPESPPPQRVDSIDSEPPMVSESSESEADEWISDVDSGEESSDVSDWTAEAGIKFINERRRKRSRRKMSNRDEEELSSEEDEEEGEEEEGDGEPGPSKRAEQRKEKKTQGLLDAGIKRESKPKKRRLVSDAVCVCVYVHAVFVSVC